MRTPRLIAAKQALFLDAYARCGSIAAAVRETGIGRERHYYWLRGRRYKIAFERAQRQALAAVEQIIRGNRDPREAASL